MAQGYEGKSAFPRTDVERIIGDPGMTQRAYFAAEAFAGYRAAGSHDAPKDVAKAAVADADALLAALNS